MELLLPVLLALPFVLAAVIVAVSFVRRRRSHAGSGPAPETVHRLQSNTASVQSAEVYPAPTARRGVSGRERRAASAPETTGG